MGNVISSIRTARPVEHFDRLQDRIFPCQRSPISFFPMDTDPISRFEA